MSNLRSDCRELVKDLPPGDVYRAHIERLCFQIDELEERWLKATSKLNKAIKQCAAYEKQYSDPELLDAEGWNGGNFNGKFEMANRIRLSLELIEGAE